MVDNKALYNIGYGLYVVTTNDGTKDNGCIVNTVVQQTSTPALVSVTVNKSNYTHDVIKQTGKLNVNCISKEAPFSLFERFGFQTGREVDKFADLSPKRSENGLAVLTEYVNSFMSLQVEQSIDLGTHTMFICLLTEAEILSQSETMTYTYYHKNVKPKPKAEKKKGYVCTICGYTYEGDPLPEDFECPWCKHGASFFEPIE